MQIDGDIEIDTDQLQDAVNQISHVAFGLSTAEAAIISNGLLRDYVDRLESATASICMSISVEPVGRVVFKPDRQRMTSGG